MVYFSLILSLLVLSFVVRLTITQRKFDWLNGLMITCALAGVILDVDTLSTGREHPAAFLLSMAVLITWFLSSLRPFGRGR